MSSNPQGFWFGVILVNRLNTKTPIKIRVVYILHYATPSSFLLNTTKIKTKEWELGKKNVALGTYLEVGEGVDVLLRELIHVAAVHLEPRDELGVRADPGAGGTVLQRARLGTGPRGTGTGGRDGVRVGAALAVAEAVRVREVSVKVSIKGKVKVGGGGDGGVDLVGQCDIRLPDCVWSLREKYVYLFIYVFFYLFIHSFIY
jgi:hypothetical protein